MDGLIYVLSGEAGKICAASGLGFFFGVVGWVLLVIKIAVPIILIIMGMIDMIKAVTSKKEDEIKNAFNKLIKRAIAAICVFLVVTIVTFLFSTIVKQTDYKSCKSCINNPASCRLSTKF